MEVDGMIPWKTTFLYKGWFAFSRSCFFEFLFMVFFFWECFRSRRSSKRVRRGRRASGRERGRQ